MADQMDSMRDLVEELEQSAEQLRQVLPGFEDAGLLAEAHDLLRAVDETLQSGDVSLIVALICRLRLHRMRIHLAKLATIYDDPDNEKENVLEVAEAFEETLRVLNAAVADAPEQRRRSGMAPG